MYFYILIGYIHTYIVDVKQKILKQSMKIILEKKITNNK